MLDDTRKAIRGWTQGPLALMDRIGTQGSYIYPVMQVVACTRAPRLKGKAGGRKG